MDVIRRRVFADRDGVRGAAGRGTQRKIADAHFVGIRSRTQLTEEVFAQAHKLVAVGCFALAPTRWT